MPTLMPNQHGPVVMKSIVVVVGGMADVPDLSLGGKTPLMEASCRSLDLLTEYGRFGSIRPVPEGIAVNTVNSNLSLLGYDFRRGVPSDATLRAFGSNEPCLANEIRHSIIPKFSGHGVVIADNPVVRGAVMMSMLRPLFPVGPGVTVTEKRPTGTLADKALSAVKAIELFDFVYLYVDEAEIASLKGDPDGKIEALERIDRELISPIADYVWNAKMQMNLAVTADHVTSWRLRCALPGDVPAVVYFNDDRPHEKHGFDEKLVEDGPLNAPLPGDLIRILIDPLPYVDCDTDLPF